MRDYIEDFAGFSLVGLVPEPFVGKAERSGVYQRVGLFPELEEGLQLFLAIQFDVPIEDGAAEVAENGRHE